MEGYVKLFRQITEWEWYCEPNTLRLFLHLLIKANHKDVKWNGMDIKRGQLFISTDTLSRQLNLTNKQIRGAKDRLIRSGELTQFGASKGTMITICKYDSYQSIEETKGKREGKRRASGGQTKGNIQECKEGEEGKELLIKELIDTPKSDFEKYSSWLKNDCPTISKMQIQLNEKQFLDISKKYGKDKIFETLLAMENKVGIEKKYKSVALTLVNWIKLNEKR